MRPIRTWRVAVKEAYASIGRKREAEQPAYSCSVHGHISYTASHEYALEYEDRLHEIRKPVLILTGEHDRTTTPRAAREMHAAIPQSELVIFPDAGHMTYIEQPELYMRAVRDFFRNHR